MGGYGNGFGVGSECRDLSVDGGRNVVAGILRADKPAASQVRKYPQNTIETTLDLAGLAARRVWPDRPGASGGWRPEHGGRRADGADRDAPEGGSGGGCGFDRRPREDGLRTEAVREGGLGGGMDRESHDLAVTRK